MTEHPSAGRVLVVCTGNVCRSPYIERALAARLQGSGIEFASAGTAALVGQSMDPETESRLRAAGGDPSGFVSRQLTEAMVAEADLVLCATRDHRTDVVRAAPKGLRYTYALGDFADIAATMADAEITGSFMDPPHASFVRRVVGTVERHRGRVQARTREQVGIVDPFRQAPEVFDRMAQQVEQLLPPIVQVLGSRSDR
jgi:protein-tyrosine phosphatase